MKKQQIRVSRYYSRPDWRTYQSGLKSASQKREAQSKFFRFCLVLVLSAVIGFMLAEAGYEHITQLSDSPGETTAIAALVPEKQPSPPSVSDAPVVSDERTKILPRQASFQKGDIQSIINAEQFTNLKKRWLEVNFKGRPLNVETTINTALQTCLLENLDRHTARYIGIVVMSPETGRILSMVSYDRFDPAHNPCLNSIFPAASVFKIVTAAAAIERCGFNPDSTLSYTGRKYTLYKSQLKKETASWGHQITLKDSFAQSINPVFGKIGLHYLGKRLLKSYAGAFGFNRDIPFELPLDISRVIVSDEPYQWAEVASGFNRTTTLSPIHGAMLVSAVVANQGKLIEPALIDSITDQQGNSLYQRSRSVLDQAVTPSAAAGLKQLMVETVQSGTCRKTFRKRETSSILSRLTIGGKTGSINSRSYDNRRFDWFVGFAEEKNGTEKIVLSIAVAHEKYIGKKSRQYAKLIIEEYFKDYFIKQRKKTKSPVALVKDTEGQES